MANANATASVDILDHAAKVGRERGRESPIPVSPAMAALAGRSARFHETVHIDQPDGRAVRGTDNPVLDQPRPGRPGDPTDNDPKQSGPNHIGRAALGQPPSACR